jgi:hypothetical protein
MELLACLPPTCVRCYGDDKVYIYTEDGTWSGVVSVRNLGQPLDEIDEDSFCNPKFKELVTVEE